MANRDPAWRVFGASIAIPTILGGLAWATVATIASISQNKGYQDLAKKIADFISNRPTDPLTDAEGVQLDEAMQAEQNTRTFEGLVNRLSVGKFPEFRLRYEKADEQQRNSWNPPPDLKPLIGPAVASFGRMVGQALELLEKASDKAQNMLKIVTGRAISLYELIARGGDKTQIITEINQVLPQVVEQRIELYKIGEYGASSWVVILENELQGILRGLSGP